MSQSRYAIQLTKRWGMKAPRQLLRMFRLHRTPFDEILNNMYSVLDDADGCFAFPTIAAIARMQPELVRSIARERHEVASHGYNHVRYPTLTKEEREKDLALSLQTFKRLGVKINGFRAPYDNYTDDMPRLLEKYQLIWDGGYGYRPEYRNKLEFFHENIDGTDSRITFIPLSIWSDDLMIDSKGMGPAAVIKILKKTIADASKKHGVIMFDLHPIRIGQQKFVGCLREIIEYAKGLGGWSATPDEAVRYWKTHQRWRGDSTFCLLLTGDIDNWVFSDYLRRMIWKRLVK